MITTAEDVRQLVEDLDQLLGVQGNFWRFDDSPPRALDSPEDVADLFRALLVDFFGLKVEGL